MDDLAQIILGDLILGGLSLLSIALIGGAAATVASFFLTPDLSNKNSATRGSSVNIRSAEEPQSVVYGVTSKGGTIFYINGTGDDNEYLHEMICLAGHECEEIGNVYFNGELVDEDTTVTIPEPDGSGSGLTAGILNSVLALQRTSLIDSLDKGVQYGTVSRINRHTGASDQLADGDAVFENFNWTADHRVRGKAYLYARLDYDAEIFSSFIPNITAEVFGKKDIFDPRDDSEQWTMNPALIIADILETYLGVPRSNIDQTSLIDAADACDTPLTTKADTTELRYTANGTFKLDGNWEDYLTPFITAMAGSVVEWGGTYYIHAGTWTDPVLTITDDDFMGPVVRKVSESEQKRANSAKGKYTSPSNYDSTTEFPPIQDLAAITEDGGDVNWLDLSLDMVNSHTQAQRLASIYLKETRLDETLSIEVPLSVGLDLKPFDNVTVDSDLFGISGQAYRVIEHTIIPGSGKNPVVRVELVLKRHDETVYDWDEDTQEQDINTAKTNLPGVGDNVPSSATYTLTNNTEDADHIAASIQIDWTDPADTPEEIEVEVQMTVESRIKDTDLGTPGDQPGSWGEVVITETRTVDEGVETITFDIEDESLTSGPYEFQNHVLDVVRIRACIGEGAYGTWLVPTSS